MNLFTNNIVVMICHFYQSRDNHVNVISLTELNTQEKTVDTQFFVGDQPTTTTLISNYMRSLRNENDLFVEKLFFIGGSNYSRRAMANLNRGDKKFRNTIELTLPANENINIVLRLIQIETAKMLKDFDIKQGSLFETIECPMCHRRGEWKNVCPDCSQELDEAESWWRVWVRGFTPGDQSRLDIVKDGFKTKAEAINWVKGLKQQGFFISAGKEKPIYSSYSPTWEEKYTVENNK